MSPNDFRKISYPEQKISTVLLTDYARTHKQKDTWTSVNLELTSTEVGQLKIDTLKMLFNNSDGIYVPK